MNRSMPQKMLGMNRELFHHDADQPGTAGTQDRAQAAAVERRADDEDFTWLMSDKRGRRLMWRQLLTPAGVFRNPYAGERGATDFNCGMQSQGQRLLASIHRLCPEKYSLMMKENARNERNQRSRG